MPLKARDRMREFEQTAQAMRNIIDGYGDRYVVPTSTLIDELAEQLGFTKGGALPKNRKKIPAAGWPGRPAWLLRATSVELNRRETAIAFILDAFNGKADSILADVREDNVGTLQQRLKDAFTVVNHNGMAFRNARILPEYLAARLEELHWAVAAQELKARDREEQRALREKIREEDKAQKEFERAQRDAQKEEEMLRRAMDKVQREVDRASDEQKAKYEDQLRDLQAQASNGRGEEPASALDGAADEIRPRVHYLERRVVRGTRLQDRSDSTPGAPRSCARTGRRQCPIRLSMSTR